MSPIYGIDAYLADAMEHFTLQLNSLMMNRFNASNIRKIN